MDLTPQYNLLSAKEKIKVPKIDYQMGDKLGGQLLASDARYWGSGEEIGVMDEHGLYIGSSDYTTAPFWVNMSGAIVASDLTLTGGTLKYGKTSFTDSTNAGYYLGSEGLYVSAATDTTKLKYTLADGSFDFIGTHSGGSVGGVSVTQVSYVATATADAVPTGLAYSTGGISEGSDGSQSAYVVLTWNAISTNTFSHYIIRYKKDALTYYTYIPSQTNTITIEGLTPNIAYNFGVASVNKYGTQSAFSSDIDQTTVSDTTPPDTVADVTTTAGIQYVIVEWTHSSAADLASYNIYRHTSDASGSASLIGNARTNYFVDGGRTGDTEYFYWVKAVDTSGNESTSFSTTASATPTNVTSDDIVTLAGSKVLIDGTTYLSNWRKTGDLTKIDGGSISTGSITTGQLNFTPVQDTDVIASINASAEGITIDADNITISGSTTFSAGYDPTGKVAALAGSYASAASGARVLIFPDANTGLQVIDDAANDVFKCLVGGTDVGDVIIGNYSGGQGIFYDKSASTTTALGTFQTAATGQRIVMASSSDAFSLYDTSNNELLKMYNAPSGANTILSITPYSSVKGLSIANDATVTFTQDLIYASITNAASTGPTMRLYHEGLGNTALFNVASNASRTDSTVYINAIAGQGAHLHLNPIATAPQTPTEGQFYTNTDHFPYYYDATAQRQIVLSGPTQTINGVKTFGSFPVTPSSAPTTDYQVANKKWVDDNRPSVVFLDGPREATEVKDYWIFSIPWFDDAAIWTRTTCNIETAYSSAQIVPTSDSSNRVLTTNGIFKVIGDHLGFDDSQKVIVEFGAILNGIGDEQIGFGLSQDGTCFGDYDRETADDACFTIDDTGAIYGHTANAGVGHTNTQITGLTLTDWNTYRIEFDPGVDVKFYVNGTLEATHTTNLPDGANDIKFGAGSSGNTNQKGQIALTEPKFAVEK